MKTNKLIINVQRFTLWKKLLLLLCLSIIIIVGTRLQEQNEQNFTENFEVAFLAKCVDGDTAYFKIKGMTEKVRFLAVDTPELATQDTYAKEASDRTCGLLKDARTIRIQYDPKADRDNYGRKLAWIFVDDKLIQEILVQEGYARVRYIYDDYLYVEHLNDLQRVAKNKNLGIWKH